MTGKEAMEVMNKEGHWLIPGRGMDPGFSIAVRIIDTRTVFGRTDYKLEPISGRGSKWVESSAVRIG